MAPASSTPAASSRIVAAHPVRSLPAVQWKSTGRRSGSMTVRANAAYAVRAASPTTSRR